MPELTHSRGMKRLVYTSFCVAAAIAIAIAWFMTRAEANTTSHVFGADWERTRATFVTRYEALHGEITDARAGILFSNAHRMCWWLAETPRLPSEALTYGTADLGMSADQTITVTELGIDLIEGCPDYNPRRD